MGLLVTGQVMATVAVQVGLHGALGLGDGLQVGVACPWLLQHQTFLPRFCHDLAIEPEDLDPAGASDVDVVVELEKVAEVEHHEQYPRGPVARPQDRNHQRNLPGLLAGKGQRGQPEAGGTLNRWGTQELSQGPAELGAVASR